MEKITCYHEYALGEQVWLLYENRAYKGKILNISKIEYPNTAAEKITYQVYFTKELGDIFYAEVKQENIFPTKEDLLEKILISKN